MKKVSPFVISEFTNASGEIVCRLYACVDGQRIRKNFATLAEAQAEREVQEVNWLQRDSGTRAATPGWCDVMQRTSPALAATSMLPTSGLY